jgi:hypothetical protein
MAQINVFSLSGCASSGTIPVNVVEPPQVTFNSSTYGVCSGQTLDVSGAYTHINPSTSASDITFTWSDSNNLISANGLVNSGTAAAGTYYVFLTANTNTGCSQIWSIPVEIYPSVSVALAPNLIFCETESNAGIMNTSFPSLSISQVPLTGTDTIDFNGTSFSPEQTGAGSWAVTVTAFDSNGCAASAVDTIEIMALPTVSVSISNDTLTAQTTGATTYQWFDCNGNAIAGATSDTYVGVAGQGYTVEVSNAACSALSDCEFVTSVANISLNGNGFRAYPNPAKQVLTVEMPTEASTVTLLNLSGTIVATSTPQQQTVKFDIADYPRGMYLIKVESEQGQAIQRIIFE